MPDDMNAGRLKAVLRNAVLLNEEATVNWVVDDTIALQMKDGNPLIIEGDEIKQWKVIRTSAPTYQSSVADMSDAQLRDSIDVLRNTRLTAPKIRKKTTREPAVDKDDPMAVALAKMEPEAKKALMKKLGMVD